MHGFCSDELSRVVPTLVGLPKPHEATRGTICCVHMSGGEPELRCLAGADGRCCLMMLRSTSSAEISAAFSQRLVGGGGAGPPRVVLVIGGYILSVHFRNAC